ncbi:hypothetical protein PSP6_690093 [Paraburkholderia tropica]|uniref:hypothetical protein n=1 Tax=Paraburkholderia tropica TaxID=92647 RepID=UPI001CB48CD4|nr:hypothetical protein [Paraburkholderia tropica]CAG9235890.1 hypothetical protein PSP6_690093 [Paraburkholderia tropica]
MQKPEKKDATTMPFPRPAPPAGPDLQNAAPIAELLGRSRKFKRWLASVVVSWFALASAVVHFRDVASDNLPGFLFAVFAVIGLIVLLLIGSELHKRVREFKPLPVSELHDLRENLLGTAYASGHTVRTLAELKRYGDEVRALERAFTGEDLRVLRRYNIALMNVSSAMREYKEELAIYEQVYGVTTNEGISE